LVYSLSHNNQVEESMNKHSKVMVAALAVLSNSAVFAGAQSSAQVSNLRFTVIDLTPDDGIAADFRFLPFQATNHPNEAGYLPVPFGGTGVPFAPAVFGQSGGGKAYSGGASTGAAFELAAGTKLVVTADASVSALATPSTCGVLEQSCPAQDHRDSGNATALLKISYQQPLVPVNESFKVQTAELSANAAVDITYYVSSPAVAVGVEATDSKTGVLTLELSNTAYTGQDIRGYVGMGANVSGYGFSSIPLQASPFSTEPITYTYEVVSRTANSTTYALMPQVPEPATWATMLLGLFGVAAVARNKQRSATQGLQG
jgi:hypothetical protein